MMKGTGFIDVATEALPLFVQILPSAYKIVTSVDASHDGVVRFIIESDDLSGHGHELTCTVKDAGSTRTIVVHLI